MPNKTLQLKGEKCHELHSLWISNKINLANLQNILDKSLFVLGFEIVDDFVIHITFTSNTQNLSII
jgi:hypothetical protein